MSAEDPSTVVGTPRPPPEGPGNARAVPALRILWHRDVARIGSVGLLLTQEQSDVSRRSAPFDASKDVVLSRDPFLTVVDRGAGIELRPRDSRVAIEVNGQAFTEARTFAAAEVSAGVILLLAREIVVCLDRIEAPVRRGPTLDMVGDSDAIEGVRRQIMSVADLDVTVLVRGATGAGKELVALAIRDASKRHDRPFVKISMADIPPQTAASALFGHERGAFTGAAQGHAGLFAEANGGTLFLDEIALAPTDIHNMLLRVLETGEIRPLGSSRARKVDVRVIAATDEKLEAAVAERRFSEPLFHRLAGYQIRVPPLRERREDIGALLLHFLRRELAAVGEADQLAARELTERPWLEAADVAQIALGELRGNVRALRNLARQLVISNRGSRHARLDAVVENMLATESAPLVAPSRPARITDDEIQAALKRHNFNFAAAADDLGINRSTLYDRIRRNPGGVRSATELSDAEILESHGRHAGDVAAMAAELRVSRKKLAARLREALGRRRDP
jgi:two-component system nitrogen regulation response regulator GlnG